MRSLISLLILSTISFSGLAQRVTFDDPDLTFSFKKPKGWQVFDDGYVVKVAPSVEDTATTYFSITYFESAQPFGNLPLTDGLERTGESQNVLISFDRKIAGEQAKYSKSFHDSSIITTYHFHKYGQRFQVKTKSSGTESKETDQTFKRIIKSIKVDD